MKQLLEAGVHFGHQTRRWNPKMRPFIFAERNGIHIIDLAQTVSLLDAALAFGADTVRRGASILFVGTKKQAQEAIAAEAERSNQHYVNNRWLGGMLTNFTTIKKRIGLPLLCDIHNDYNMALMALDKPVDKIRINPGNNGGGTCYGDSGGPIFYRTGNVIGAVTSFGYTPCIGVDYQYRIDTPVALAAIPARTCFGYHWVK